MRHTLHRFMSQHVWKSGHLTPAEELQSLLLHDDFKHLLRLVSAQFLLREEEHSHAVLSLLSKFNAQRLCHSGKKLMRNLGQDTHAVAGLSLGILSGSVFQIFHYLQGILYRLPALLAIDIYTGADTTIVVFKLLSVKRCFRYFLLHIKHGCTPFVYPTLLHTKKDAMSLFTPHCVLLRYYTLFLSICKQLLFHKLSDYLTLMLLFFYCVNI